MSNNFVARNIVLLFEDELNQEFIRLSRLVAKHVDSKIVLNTSDAFPHVSLYQALFPIKNEKLLEESIQKVVMNFRPFRIEFISKSVQLGTIFIDAVRSPELQAIHESLVDSLNDLREGAYDKEALTLPNMPDFVKDNLEKYGMWAAKEHYMPHVSVGRCFDSEDIKKALALIPESISIQTIVSKVSLIESGPHGTCKKILKTFTLG